MHITESPALPAIYPAKKIVSNSHKKEVFNGIEKIISYNHIWMLSTFPPRECGIATFSKDLQQAVTRLFGESVKFRIAAVHDNKPHEYPEEVSVVFNSGLKDDYNKLARKINNDSYARGLIVQHEFGLFDDHYLPDFVKMLKSVNCPVVFVMHTVLPNPDDFLKQKVCQLAEASTTVIVMTHHSAGILEKDYGIADAKLTVIPHGTHLVKLESRTRLKKKYGLQERTVLSTFGLISRDKSIETSIEALSRVVKDYPQVVFLVLGRTHPTVAEHEGESYREELQALVKKYHLENNVRFINKYLSLSEILEYLQATDIYLFTSHNPLQAVSGTFSYALSTNSAIVSTPIPHAVELLKDGDGLLFDFDDPESLATQILRFLRDPDLRERLAENAMKMMSSTAWENVANQYLTLIKSLNTYSVDFRYSLPPVNTDYLKKMTTGTGIIQFAHLQHPDLSSGYTLDDNARALIAACMLYCKSRDKEILKLMNCYLEFIRDCQLSTGKFLNFRNGRGVFTEKNNRFNLEDATGRAIWALGFLLSQKDQLPPKFASLARKLIKRAIPELWLMKSPRAVAFSIKGLYYYSGGNPAPKLKDIFKNLADKLMVLYNAHATGQWHWFEPYITYGNAVLPEALLAAYQCLKDPSYKKIAKESFDFLLSKTITGGKFIAISNRGWLQPDKIPAKYGEQPIDAACTIMALDRFHQVYPGNYYTQKIRLVYDWFLGRNILNQIVYNPITGGCFDGLEESGVNLNQGAESTVCHLIARLMVEPYYIILNTFNEHQHLVAEQN